MTMFARCACPPTKLTDAARRGRDPTQTADIRGRFETDFGNRTRVLKKLARKAILDDDMLGYSKLTVALIAAPHPPGQQVEQFQNWFWSAIQSVLIGREGAFSWVGQYIRAGYDRGWTRAMALSGKLLPPDHARLDMLVGLGFSELEGVADALYQRANRDLTNLLLRASTKQQLYAAVANAVDTVGLTRGKMLAQTMVVRAHAEATLDGLQAAGVHRVGVQAETVPPKRRVGDAKTTGGPGSRVPKSQTPSPSTIGRIEKVQSLLEPLGQVEVITAEDDFVCPQCEDIADGNPYDIDEARGLIPAHPNCRCAFVPVFDDRYGGDDDLEDALVRDDGPEDEPRGPDGKWVGGGGGGGASASHHAGLTGKLKGSSVERVALRKALKDEKDPEKRKQIKARIVASFQVQHVALMAKGQHDKAALIEKKLLKAGGTPVESAFGKSAVFGKLNTQHAEPFKPVSEPGQTAKAATSNPAPLGPDEYAKATGGSTYTPEQAAKFAELAGAVGNSQASSFIKSGMHDKGWNGLDEYELAHIKAYTGHAYDATNASLRAGKMKEEQLVHVRALNAALDKIPAYIGTSARRIHDSDGSIAAQYEKGFVHEERGFVSSSRGDKSLFGGGHLTYSILGKTGRHVAAVSSHPSEDEVLFKSGTRFKVLDKVKTAGETHIKMQEV